MKISNNDKRSYKSLVLDNGLTVLIAHDPTATKSAAALTVNAGHFDDPTDRQGMAHFVEHMLFLGTVAHPKPGYFSQFISQAGGQSNAWTGAEHTCYYFDCDQQQINTALSLFSEFFKQPLFDANLADNERNAIDAEFRMKIKDDGRRIYQVHKETVNPEHPFAKFSVGNKQTLADREHCVAQEVKAFFDKFYQAQWMKLVLVGPQSLIDLEELVVTNFSKVAGSQTKKVVINTPLYRDQDLQQLLHITPKKHMQKLIVSFPMPHIPELYKSKTLSFIAHLLGYEGTGSLYSILKSQGWINALSAGGGISGSNFKDFNISFALTDTGIEYYEDIVEMLFEYIALIKQKTSVLPDLYKDKKALLDMAFDNQEPTKLLDWASNVSVNMHHYDKADYLYGDYMMTGFDESLNKKLCDYLVPHNMRLVLIHPDVDANKKAQWYNTAYCVEKIDSEWLKMMAKVQHPLPEMQLPSINPYLQAEQTLKPIESPTMRPVKLADSAGLSFWFLQDCEFRVTKGHFYIEIDSKSAISSVKNMALTRLFADLLMDSMAEQFYPAELAGLSYHITSHQGGLTLHTAGLSGKQPEFALELLSCLLTQPISATRFAEYKKQLIRHWKNHNLNKPVSELFSILGASIMPWSPSPDSLAQALKTTCFNEFQSFRAAFFEAVHIKSFLFGNWIHKDAQNILNKIKSTFKNSEILDDLKRPLNELSPMLTEQIVREQSEFGFLHYVQSPSASVENKVSCMLINQLIQQDYFEELRTNQQLGYLVGAGYAPFNTRAGVAFYIQSPNHNSQKLFQAHKVFLKTFVEKLYGLNESAWLDAKQALYIQVAERDKNLRLRSQRLWVSITNEDFNFDMQTRLINAIDAIDKLSFIAFSEELLQSEESGYLLFCN